MLLSDAELANFLNAYGGTMLTMAGVAGTTIAGGIAWLARVIWVRFEAAWNKFDERAAKTATKTDTLIDTMTEHAPKHTKLLENLSETQHVIASDLKESHRRDSDVIRQIDSIKDAGVELVYGLEAFAIEHPDERTKEILRCMERSRQRLGMMPRKKSVKPGMEEPNE